MRHDDIQPTATPTAYDKKQLDDIGYENMEDRHASTYRGKIKNSWQKHCGKQMLSLMGVNQVSYHTRDTDQAFKESDKVTQYWETTCNKIGVNKQCVGWEDVGGKQGMIM